ncbi:hypothetical protein [Tolypothrix sp. VBCCA 56010]|uniref:hypothetical protein n=1 Tax=Tolypothrix sp. VBCCA 56010 TaxID=3137731 RepID=UPI003D7EB628
MHDDGTQITVTNHRCKNPECNKHDFMRRILTSLTPDGSSVFNVNSSKNQVTATNNYFDFITEPEYDDDGNIIDVHSEPREETDYYSWDFVECRHCKKYYVLQSLYSTLAEEKFLNLYPLFTLES